jgi:outer membrane lipoprotein carrier protein
MWSMFSSQAFLFVVSTMAAGPVAPVAPAPANIDSVVDSVQKTVDATTSFRASFHQKFTLAMLHRTQESDGTLQYDRPGRIRFDYAAPAKKSFVVDGKSLWMVQPEDNTAFVNACFKQDGLTASVAFLFGQGNMREQFNIAFFDGVFGDVATDHHLLLTPKTENSVFSKLILVVDKETSRVKQSVVVDPAGNVNQFIYGDMVVNEKTKKDAFRVKLPAGVQAQRMPGSCSDAIPGVK